MGQTILDQLSPRTARRAAPAIWGSLLALLLAVPAVHAADWYASPSGDNANDCASAVTACKTIQAAIDMAAENDTVHVAAGEYPFATPGIEINKEGLTLQGGNTPFLVDPHTVPGQMDNLATGTASVLKAPASGSGNTSRRMLWVNNVKEVTVRNLYFETNLGRTKEAIVATGSVDGLLIDNNYIKFTAKGTDAFGISINPEAGAGMKASVAFNPVNGSFVTIRNNVLEPTIGSSAYDTRAPKRAILFNRSVGLIEGNQIAASTTDLWAYQINAVGSGQTTLTIQNNWFFGRLQNQIMGTGGSTSGINILNNHYWAPGSSASPVTFPGLSPASLTSSESHLLRLQGGSAVPTLVEGNDFRGFTNQYRAVWVQGRRGVTIKGNTFEPEVNASDFTAITVGNRSVETGAPGNPVKFGGLDIVGNTFSGSGAANNGKAVLFVNDNDKGGLANGDLPDVAKIGGALAADANGFDANIAWYVALDDRSCTALNHTGTTAPCSGGTYAIGPGISYSGGANTASEKRPFNWDVNAAGNRFGGVLMANMDQAQYDAVWAKTYDDHNNVQSAATVGNVIYDWTPPAPDVALTITEVAGNDNKTGTQQNFTLAAENNGGDGVVRGRITLTRADGSLIPMAGGGMDEATDALAVDTDLGPATLFRAADGKGVSLIWPEFDVPLASGDSLPPQGVYVLFRVPGEYHVYAEIVDAGDYDINYGDTAFDYAITQDLDVQFTGTNPTIYDGSAQPLGFSVSPVSNPAVADMAAKIGLVYGGDSAAPVNAGTYVVDAHSNDGDYIVAAPATESYVIQQASAEVQWGTLNFAYNGSSHAVSATAGAIACSVTPASIGPGIGDYPLNASCADANFSYSNTSVMASIGGASAVHVQETGLNYASVADALDDSATEDGMTIQLAPGTYSGPIVLTKAVSLVGGIAFMDGRGPVLTAGPIAPPTTVIDGRHAAGTGILIATGVQDATISGVEVTAFTQDCIFAQQGNDGLRVEESIVHDCGRHGIHVNGGVADVSIERNHVYDTGNRGIVVWNGFKQDITINDNLISGPIGATAISLDDGTAAGVHITNNEIDHTAGGDTGIAVMQLTDGATSGRGNLISNNTITDPGRFGIALMIPNGSGMESGDGSIVVEGNTIIGGSNQGAWLDDDRAGIQVIRRYYAGASQGQVDVTRGVVIHSNSVTDISKPGAAAGIEGYGIVVEGLGSSVYDNILEGNDVGLQVQQGNQSGSLPGDSDLDIPSDWFDRGNAPLTCAGVGDNVITDSLISDERYQPASASMLGGIKNERTGEWYCSINDAITAADAGDTLSVIAGDYDENVIVNKTVTLKGPKAGVAGFDPSRDGSGEAVLSGTIAVRAIDAVVDGITLAGGSPAGVTQNGGERFQLLNTRLLDISNDGVALSGSVDWQIRDNLFRNIRDHGIRVHGGTSTGIVIDGNHFETVGAAVQMIKNDGAQITNNTVDATVGYALQVANSSNVQLRDNIIRGADLGVLLDRNNANVAISCNDIEGVTFGILAMDHVAPGTETMTILHNRVVAPHHLRTAWGAGETFVVGANFYDGAELVISTPNGAELLVADALASNPIGAAACGDNAPVALVAHSGTPQSTEIDEAFVDPLQARIIDALGGAVTGETVVFAAPTSGASAVLAATSVVTDHNGVATITAQANSQVGSYTVGATSGTFSADFHLTNSQGMAVVTVADASVTYDGQSHAVGVSTDPAGLEGDVQVTYRDAATNVVATCVATDTTCGPVDAGAYSASATISGNPNYSGTGTGTLTIGQATGTVEWLSTSFVYDGSAHTPTARITEEPASSCLVSGTVGPDVGSYPISANCSGQNYEASDQRNAQVTPASASITLSHLVQAHDGTPKSVGVNTTPSGLPVTVTYDGSAMAPSAVGSYVVQANIADTNYSGSAGGTLEIVPGTSDIALILNGPVDPIRVADTAQYAATMLANPALHSGETFGFKITLNKSGGNHALELDDLASMEVFYQGDWMDGDDLGVTFTEEGGNLVYIFPEGILTGGFPIADPSWTWNFRFSFGDTGTYTTTAELVDGISHAPIAPAVQASFATVVQAALPPTDIKLVLGGPAGEVSTGAFAEYSTTLLANPQLHLGELFFVKVTLSKSTGAMSAADLEQMQVFLGGDWVDGDDFGVTFTEEGGNLVYLFPESLFPNGFPIDNEEWSWNFRFAFAEAAVYTSTAEVMHASEAALANPEVFASAAIATTVVDAPVMPPQMNVLLLGPVDDVQLGAPALYTGSLLANPDDFSGHQFFVRVRLSKNGGVTPMQIADLERMELHDGSGWYDATDDLHPQLIVDGNELVYLFPQPFMNDGFPIDEPLWSWYFRFTYGDIGLYTALADVIDAADSDPLTATPLANASVQTNVVPPSADVFMQINGPVAGVEVDVPAAYIGRLINLGSALAEDAFVKVSVSHDGGPLVVGDVTTEVWFNNDWVEGTLSPDGSGGLEVDFPDSDGFPIAAGFDYTHQFRITYHKPGLFNATATLVGADSADVYATSSMFTEVVAQSANVSMQINGPVAGVEVDVPAAYIGRLVNHGPTLPENAFVKVSVSHDGGPLVLGDVTTEVWFDGDWVEGTLVPDGSGGLEVDFPDSDGFPIVGGFDYTHQFRITYHKPGVFNAAATLVGADSADVYATSSMYTQVIARQDVTVGIDIDPASLQVVYNGLPHSATATTNPAGLPVVFSYNGVSNPPVDAGQYVVVATVNDAHHVGSTSAIMTITPAQVTLTLSVTTHVYDGSPKSVTVNTTPAGLDVDVTYDGLTAPPVDAGSYTVLATVTNPNYSGSVVGQMVIDKAQATLTLSDTTHVYDASAKSATVVTDPLGLPVNVTYDGSTTSPAEAGSYTVLATVTDANYTGSVVGQLVIEQAQATLTLSNTEHVFDGSAKAVTVVTAPANLANDVTYDGSATPPSAIGSYAVVATVTDSNYQGQVSGLMTITAADATDLSVSISNDRDFVQYGKLMTWFIRVNNIGNTDVTGATVSSILPPELEDGLWSCMALGTATCTADGAGDLVDTVSIPQGGGVLYVLTARVVDEGQLSEVVNVVVTVSAAGDVESNNDTATDSTIVTLFRDGFQKGDGAQDIDGADEDLRHELQGDDVVNVTVPHGLPAGRVSILAQGQGGGAEFRVEAIATPGALYVRLIVGQGGFETASAWSVVAAGDALALGTVEPSGQLLLVGAATDLQLSTSGSND